MITMEHFPHIGFEGATTGPIPALQFVAMANLTVILSDILSAFYTLRAMDTSKCMPIELLISRMSNFQLRLQDFQEQHLCRLSNVNTLLDSTGTTFLAYYTVELVLYRALLRCVPLTEPVYLNIRSHARSTALSITEFLDKLQANRLQAFWWSREYYSNLFASKRQHEQSGG